MSNVSEWSTTAANNNTAAPDGSPEGQTAASLNNVIREMMAALSKWYKDSAGAVQTAGSSNAYTITTNSVHTALSDIPLLVMEIDRDNTGPVTLNVDGLGAKSWYKSDLLNEYLTGELRDGEMAVVIYNSTADHFVSVQNTETHALPRGHLSGLAMSNGTDSDHDLNFAVGEARDDTNKASIRVTTAITKRLDATWTVGTGNGMLDTGTIATATYHVFAIRRSDTGVTDFIASQNATTPSMPTNYDCKRRIGSIYTDGSANIVAFVQVGDRFDLDVPVSDWHDDPLASIAAVTRTVSVPTGIVVDAVLSWTVYNGEIIDMYSIISPLDVADTAPTEVLNNMMSRRFSVGEGNDEYQTVWINVRTNTSAQFRTRTIPVSGSETDDVETYGHTFGWIDRRGQDD